MIMGSHTNDRQSVHTREMYKQVTVQKLKGILIFSLRKFKRNCKYLAFTCHGWYSTCCVSLLSRMTKVTLTAFTYQCIIIGQILAAVGLGYRSACLMIMLRLGVVLFVVVSVFCSSLGPTY